MFICSRVWELACAASLRTTNSPGINTVGTLSLFPVPGTHPPLAIRFPNLGFFNLVAVPGVTIPGFAVANAVAAAVACL